MALHFAGLAQEALAGEPEPRFVEQPGLALPGPAPIAPAPKMPGQPRSSIPKTSNSVCWALPRGYQNRFNRERSSARYFAVVAGSRRRLSHPRTRHEFGIWRFVGVFRANRIDTRFSVPSMNSVLKAFLDLDCGNHAEAVRMPRILSTSKFRT